MIPQSILTKSYIRNIFEQIERNENLNLFLQDTFPYDKKEILVTPKVNKPKGLLEKMVPTTEGDFTSAVALYEAYKSLTPLQAINAQFWESLTLTDLFPYMQQRWNLKNAKDLQRSILNHFKVSSRGIIRHGLGGLWWLVHLTVDPKRDNPYELTEMLFKNYTLRYIRFGAGKVIQHKAAAMGILQYIKDHEEEITNLENIASGLTSYFNKLGAVKQLTALEKEFFYNEMAIHINEFKIAKTHERANYESNEEELNEEIEEIENQ